MSSVAGSRWSDSLGIVVVSLHWLPDASGGRCLNGHDPVMILDFSSLAEEAGGWSRSNNAVGDGDPESTT